MQASKNTKLVIIYILFRLWTFYELRTDLESEYQF